MAMPTLADMNDFIRRKAAELGIDLDAANAIWAPGGASAQPQMTAYHTDDTPAMGAAMGGFATGPGDVQERMDTGAVAGLLDEDPSWLAANGAGLAKMGLGIIDRAKKKKAAAAEEPPPQALVLQPLKRYTLEGLL